MIDRTGDATHVYLVRGKSTDSVVTELHRQLIRSGRLPRHTRRAAALPGLLLSVTAVAFGLMAVLLGTSAPR
jgi:hypothetical protein